MSPATSPAIDVRGLDVFRSGEPIIKKASFIIDNGEYVGLVGPNGGGKTTLLLSILGMIPGSGSIKLFGKPLQEFNDWKRVAYVSQSAINFDSTFPLTVKEMVSLGLVSRERILKRLSKDDWRKVEETMKFMGIADLQGKRIGEISGGQKQRMFVAKALVREPDLLILDEPVAGVDASTLERFYQKLSDLNSQKETTIVMVSHDLAAVFCRMSKVICVNRDVHYSAIDGSEVPQALLKKAYGEHFHFVFHQHQCKGDFS